METNSVVTYVKCRKSLRATSTWVGGSACAYLGMIEGIYIFNFFYIYLRMVAGTRQKIWQTDTCKAVIKSNHPLERRILH
jgi:hypothetical protein